MRYILFNKHVFDDYLLPDINGIICQRVCFNSNNLNDLLLVAKYKIVNFPSSIIIDKKDKLILKMRGNIPIEYLNELLSKELGNDL